MVSRIRLSNFKIGCHTVASCGEKKVNVPFCSKWRRLGEDGAQDRAMVCWSVRCMWRASRLIFITFWVVFFLSSVSLFTQKMYCSLYYVHSTHNPTIFASSRVNQHLYKYDNVRCELFFYFRFLPEPNQVQKTLYYLFWRNMYLFWHYIHLYWHHVKWPDWTRSIPGHPSQTQVRYPSTSSHVISFFQFEFPHNLNHH